MAGRDVEPPTSGSQQENELVISKRTGVRPLTENVIRREIADSIFHTQYM